MADGSVLASAMDISKLKVPDLKRELKLRGLNISGNKNELIERLQASLKPMERASNESVDEFDEDLLNEDDDDHLETAESIISDIDTALIIDALPLKVSKRKVDETENGEDKTVGSPPKKLVLNRNNPLVQDTRTSTESKDDSDKTNGSADEKKVVKISALTAKERLEMRAKKFDATSSSSDAKKLARAERFGITSITPTKSSSNTAINTKVDTNLDVLKQRAERFGGSVSKAMSSLEVQERMEKRKERFGIVTQTDKAKQRLERFKQPVK